MGAILIARGRLLAPREFPTIVHPAIPSPNGTINASDATCRMITYAATSSVPRKPAMMTVISKAHHSEHNIAVPGKPREMNCHHSCVLFDQSHSLITARVLLTSSYFKLMVNCMIPSTCSEIIKAQAKHSYPSGSYA